MNPDKALLGLELRLLIARHGKPRVSEVLSSIEEFDLATLDSEVKAYEEGRSRRRRAQPRPRKSVDEMIRQANPENPDAEPLIRRLALAYEDKRFLPGLREVKRFLEFRQISADRFRSRADALPVVIKVLAKADPHELAAFDEKREARGGDLGIIAAQILGHGSGSGTRAGPRPDLPAQDGPSPSGGRNEMPSGSDHESTSAERAPVHENA